MGENSKKIRLGICMAGAVSAGAYTAGVVDYLIETLERWEQAKKRIKEKERLDQKLTAEEELIPLHDLVIEVLSGSSAGGMTAAVLSYSFNDGSYLTRRNGELISENYDCTENRDSPTKLYDSWINMVDEEGSSTFTKLMHPEDVVTFGQMKSLLNSQPIDDIASRAIPDKIDFTPPKYISEHLSILLSVTNLEGIPVDIDFTNMGDNNPTRNVLTTHSGFMHYKFKEEEHIDFDYPPLLITDDSKDRLALAAMATGAFPFGLSNRKIEIERKHFEKFRARMKAKNMNVNLSLPDNHNYTFTAVDGGAINNEPISTTFRLLEKKRKAHHEEDKHYVILIDPFPTITNATRIEDYEHPGDEGYALKDQFFKLIQAFRNESSFKQEDLHERVAGEERYLIAPSKKGFYFLACGLIEGFGGFMKKAFRKHDYQLGRKNCQAFLRYHFGEEPQRFADITGVRLTEAQEAQWRYDANYSHRGMEDYHPHFKIPLIPDMIMLQKTKASDFKDLNKENLAELQKVRTEIAEPKYNGLTTQELSEITRNIQDRIDQMVAQSYPDIKKMAKGVNKWLGRFVRWFPRFVKKKISGSVSGKIEPYLMRTFSALTLEQKELVKNYIKVIENGGKYQKTAAVEAIVAKGGERVVSFVEIIDEKEEAIETAERGTLKEDWSIAEPGEYIVTNGTKRREQYIVTPENFNRKYVKTGENSYQPNENAQVYALQISEENIRKFNLKALENLISSPMNPVYIEPKWELSQSLYLDDYLVVPVESRDEVYCIKKDSFEDTYSKISIE
ncbi:patatin-like phospholipase family protein [Poritiphilus flavus]|uniref:PNPLA domain-containing protein n=1 Tax=Poritiphilus flavus TaxID=2697053 RepID=A0A6L9E9M8_9FLAO|nr:patatin-like phospholipase family protein [Poritiphilus flavus]NAS11487.1 hypothetical protein [Poritiphilus flavus]